MLPRMVSRRGQCLDLIENIICCDAVTPSKEAFKHLLSAVALLDKLKRFVTLLSWQSRTKEGPLHFLKMPNRHQTFHSTNLRSVTVTLLDKHSFTRLNALYKGYDINCACYPLKNLCGNHFLWWSLCKCRAIEMWMSLHMSAVHIWNGQYISKRECARRNLTLYLSANEHSS